VDLASPVSKQKAAYRIELDAKIRRNEGQGEVKLETHFDCLKHFWLNIALCHEVISVVSDSDDET